MTPFWEQFLAALLSKLLVVGLIYLFFRVAYRRWW